MASWNSQELIFYSVCFVFARVRASWQVMHIIDEVLVPLTAQPSTKTEITNPDAFQFLQQADLLNIGENRLR